MFRIIPEDTITHKSNQDEDTTHKSHPIEMGNDDDWKASLGKYSSSNGTMAQTNDVHERAVDIGSGSSASGSGGNETQEAARGEDDISVIASDIDGNESGSNDAHGLACKLELVDIVEDLLATRLGDIEARIAALEKIPVNVVARPPDDGGGAINTNVTNWNLCVFVHFILFCIVVIGEEVSCQGIVLHHFTYHQSSSH